MIEKEVQKKGEVGHATKFGAAVTGSSVSGFIGGTKVVALVELLRSSTATRGEIVFDTLLIFTAAVAGITCAVYAKLLRNQSRDRTHGSVRSE